MRGKDNPILDARDSELVNRIVAMIQSRDAAMDELRQAAAMMDAENARLRRALSTACADLAIHGCGEAAKHAQRGLEEDSP